MSRCAGPTFFAICSFSIICLRLLQAGESLVEVLHQRGVPAREILRRSEFAEIRERLQRGWIATREVDDPRPGPTCHLARPGSRCGLSRGHAAAKLITQLSPLGLDVFRCGPFFAARLATASDASHRFDHGEYIVGLHVAVRVRTRVVEERPKALEPLDLDIHTIPMRTQNIGERDAVVFDDATDIREREAEVAQRTDATQTLNVVLVVDSLVTIRPRRRHEQPDVVVVVERAHGQASCARQLSDTPASVRRPHRWPMYNLTSRQVQAENRAWTQSANPATYPPSTEGPHDSRITMTKPTKSTLLAPSALRVRTKVRAGGFDTAGAVK